MIIELLLSGLYNIFSILTSVINIPSISTDAVNQLYTYFNYIESGVGILAIFTNINIVLSLFSIIIAIDIGLAVYHFVMWILKKIPMLSMS